MRARRPSRRTYRRFTAHLRQNHPARRDCTDAVRGSMGGRTDPVTLRRALIPILAVAAVAATAGSFAPAADAAQAPCWKVLLNDWYDGRIDDSYPVRCYREAIDNLPDDVDAYTEAREDIQRALLAAVRTSGGTLDADDLVPPEPGNGSGRDGAGGEDDGDGDSDGDGIPNDEDEDTDTTAGPGDDRGDDGLVGFFRPSNADEIPLPLLLLAGLAVLLLAAASAGFVTRRLQARRLRPAAARNRAPAPPDA